MPTTITLANTSPHEDVDVLLRGNTENPKRALLLFHGRGASAENILGLTRKFELSANVLVCAPQAHGGAWYPKTFTAPRTENEPHLGSALHMIEELIAYCGTTYGIKPASIALVGFSQGACLISQYVAMHPAKYGGVCIYSGGLIGTDEEIEKDTWQKSGLNGTSIYLGCDQHDPFIPAERVHATAAALEKQGANVTSKLYTGLGHAIHPEGVTFLSDLL
jgi:phospholipase/carboxylesterase